MNVVKSLMDNFWIKLMKLGNWSGCHQISERSFFILNYQVPVCSRCTGIFIGQIISIFIILFRINISIYFLIIALLPMLLDGTLQYYNIIKSTNLRRFTTGLLFGFSYIYLIFKVISSIITK